MATQQLTAAQLAQRIYHQVEEQVRVKNAGKPRTEVNDLVKQAQRAQEPAIKALSKDPAQLRVCVGLRMLPSGYLANKT
jgi:hypothetical protein